MDNRSQVLSDYEKRLETNTFHDDEPKVKRADPLELTEEEKAILNNPVRIMHYVMTVDNS